MPGYVTHYIFGREVYHNLKNNSLKKNLYYNRAAYAGVWHIEIQKSTTKPWNRLIFLSNFYFYYIVIFGDMWYNSDRGDYCAYNNIKIKKFWVLLHHSVLYKCQWEKYFQNHPKIRYVSWIIGAAPHGSWRSCWMGKWTGSSWNTEI